MTPFANHLWQSTIFALAAWLLTLALRHNRASVRYSLWLAASLKFLLPFSLLMSLGRRLPWPAAPALAAPQVVNTLTDFSQPFTLTPSFAAAPSATHLSDILFTLWLAGIALGLIHWTRTLLRIRALKRAATPVNLRLPVLVLSSPARLEPGVFGIRRPVLILPHGIADRLTPAQFAAVLAHELCHVRRRDNLTAALHMLVETLFWFHPLVWWIRTQLVAERERACDEAVLARAADPQTYAEAILNVCKLCVESPALCASGIAGGDLKTRITRIVNRATGLNLTLTRKTLLAVAAGAAIAVPLAIGSSQSTGPVFEVASVKINKSGSGDYDAQMLPGGKVSAHNLSLQVIISLAWHVRPNMIFGGPGWLDSDHYDIVAKARHDASEDEMRRMMQALLIERFKLAVHSEDRMSPGYALIVGKTGLKLGKPDVDQQHDEGCDHVVGQGGPGERHAECYMGMEKLAEALPVLAPGYFAVGPVVDQTGLHGYYKLQLDWVGVNQLGTSLFDSVEKLGLKLDSRKISMPSVVIDHVERIPTEN